MDIMSLLITQKSYGGTLQEAIRTIEDLEETIRQEGYIPTTAEVHLATTEGYHEIVIQAEKGLPEQVEEEEHGNDNNEEMPR